MNFTIIKTLNLKRAFTIGLSVFCLLYANISQAKDTHFPNVNIKGLNKYVGKSITIFYVSAKTPALSFGRGENMTVNSIALNLTKTITDDTIKIDSGNVGPSPEARNFIPNALIIVIHDGNTFQLVNKDGSINSNSIADRKVPQHDISESAEKSDTIQINF